MIGVCWFLAGLFLGGSFGLLAMGLLVAASRADEEMGQ